MTYGQPPTWAILGAIIGLALIGTTPIGLLAVWLANRIWRNDRVRTP